MDVDKKKKTMATYDEIPEDRKQFLETMKCIKIIEELFYNCSKGNCDLDDIGSDKGIIYNPMLYLANAIFIDNNQWAEDLAKYLCVMCDLECIDLKTERKYS